MFLSTENGSGYVNSDRIEVIGLIKNKDGKIDVVAIKDANATDEDNINSYRLATCDDMVSARRYVNKINRMLKGEKN